MLIKQSDDFKLILNYDGEQLIYGGRQVMNIERFFMSKARVVINITLANATGHNFEGMSQTTFAFVDGTSLDLFGEFHFRRNATNLRGIPRQFASYLMSKDNVVVTALQSEVLQSVETSCS